MSEVRGRNREDPMPEGRWPRGVTPRLRSGAEAGRTPCPKGGGQEELPQARGQGQKPGGPHAQRAVAKRSYPTSEVRGSARECQDVTAQEWLRGATQVQGQGQRLGGVSPRSRSGEAAKRSYPASEVRGRGWEDQPHIEGAVAERAQEGLAELSHIEGQEGRR